MNTKLITALRTSANALENGTFAYEWSNPESCNCGILACALLGKSIVQMKDIMPTLTKSLKPNKHHWTNIAANHCPITGIPENEILKAMMQAGMTQSDFQEMEYLSNPEVQKRAIKSQGNKAVFNTTEITTGHFWNKRTASVSTGKYSCTDKANVIAYMRSWADILTEQGKLDTVESSAESHNHHPSHQG